MKISQIKSSLQAILSNINELQTYRDSLVHNTQLPVETDRIAKCRDSLEREFVCLESETVKEAANQLKRRRKLRLRRAKKRKIKKNTHKSSDAGQSERFSISQTPKPQQLTYAEKRELRDAKKYLSMIESLETLHKLNRGGDSCKLREALNPIRSIWQATEESIRAKERQLLPIEKQWDLALFGQDTNVNIECGLRNFIEKRRVWDSYLVSGYDSTGSYIPIGWVCPKEDARPEWKQFQM